MIPGRVAVLAAVLVGQGVAQENVKEERIAELVEQLKEVKRFHVAEQRLIAIGRPVAKPLERAIRDEEDHTERLLAVLGKTGPAGADSVSFLLDYIESGPEEHRLAALAAVGTLAPFCDRQTKALLRQTLTSKPQSSAIDELRWYVLVHRFRRRVAVDGLGPWEELSRELERDTAHRREVVAEAIGHRRLVAAVPDLVAALKNGHRYSVASPSTLEALRVLHYWVRVEGIAPGHSAHKIILAQHETAVETSNRLLPDTFQQTAAEVLIALAPRDRRIIPAYCVRMRNHESADFRAGAARVLGGHGAAASMAVSDVVKALGDESAMVAREAVTALGMIGPPAKDAIPALEKLTMHKDKQISERAKAALRQIRGK